ncbi:ABC transporter ATP-binding protein [Zavarzinia compransoris]|uniref:ABC transporter ATP-binding protein n=1 Tax=Zavarzinia compransoris TaxID=1264899 RepID=UPI00105EE5D1|nr:ABC transporter ATP-binding protein [Zavarzinia compransoris]TDP47359.1 spermidine/putrescine transport system ATP-binding protein [Zavarzinia compransoris]
MNDIVRLEGVSKVYGSFTAVDNIDLAIREGEFVTLLGPSGCGKTTTLRMIAGFETADRGRIFLGTDDVTDRPPYRRPVNTVFQDYALFPHMTVARNVAYGLDIARGRSRKEIETIVFDCLNLVGLADKAGARPGQLSGGQRQRVAMARALACKPKVLLLDEPLSALDVKLREAMQVELKHLHEKLGITFLMVTHDQQEALVMSDRVVVMRNGRIEQSGTPFDLYDRPNSPYVADFIGASNLLAGTVTVVAGREVAVDIGGQAIRGRLAETAPVPAPGQAATVGLRPERLRIGAAPEGDESGLAVEITGHLFHGGAFRLEARVAGGKAALTIDLQRRSLATAEVIPAVGTLVQAHVRAADAVIFPEGAL